jgi:hypothetical protein
MDILQIKGDKKHILDMSNDEAVVILAIYY